MFIYAKIAKIGCYTVGVCRHLFGFGTSLKWQIEELQFLPLQRELNFSDLDIITC